MGDKIQHTKGPWSSIQRERSLPHVMGGDHCRITVVDDTHIGYETTGNAALLMRATEAPHDCDHDGCPGRENKRKLEAFAAIRPMLQRIYDHAPCDSVREIAGEAIARWEGR